jgi:Flp pilus assembly pilin Flp
VRETTGDEGGTVTAADSRKSARDETGQTLVEYALIIAVVSLGAIVALGFLSGKINELFSKAGNSLNAVAVAAPGGSTGGTTGGGGPTGGTTGGSPPSGGNVNISCVGTCTDSETLTATASWSSGSPTSYTFTWETATSFINGSPDTCDPGGSYGSPSQGPTTQPSGTSTFFTPNQSSGNGDSVRVTVTATNGNGTSSAVTDCVVVENS